jgi:hypothetical protein
VNFEFENQIGNVEGVSTWRNRDSEWGINVHDDRDEPCEFFHEDIPKLIAVLQQAYEYIQQQKEKA